MLAEQLPILVRQIQAATKAMAEAQRLAVEAAPRGGTTAP